jgi:hypothetical protein
VRYKIINKKNAFLSAVPSVGRGRPTLVATTSMKVARCIRLLGLCSSSSSVDQMKGMMGKVVFQV